VAVPIMMGTLRAKGAPVLAQGAEAAH
jgi:hypothetical protein